MYHVSAQGVDEHIINVHYYQAKGNRSRKVTCKGCLTHRHPFLKAEMSGTTHNMLSSDLPTQDRLAILSACTRAGVGTAQNAIPTYIRWADLSRVRWLSLHATPEMARDCPCTWLVRRLWQAVLVCDSWDDYRLSLDIINPEQGLHYAHFLLGMLTTPPPPKNNNTPQPNNNKDNSVHVCARPQGLNNQKTCYPWTQVEITIQVFCPPPPSPPPPTWTPTKLE